MITVQLLQRGITPGHLGFIPTFISENDPRSAREQFDANYAHGGGWYPMSKWKLNPDNSLKYPEDPPLEPWAMMQLRHESIFMYASGFVAIVQPDRSFEVARLD